MMIVSDISNSSSQLFLQLSDILSIAISMLLNIPCQKEVTSVLCLVVLGVILSSTGILYLVEDIDFIYLI